MDWLVCVGTDLATSRAAIAAAERHDDVYATVGLHPHDANRASTRSGTRWSRWRSIRASSRSARPASTSTTLHSPFEDQEAAFRAQIQLAHETDLALVIHSREAWDDTFRVLEDEGVPARTVFHCFTGGPREAQRALDLGTYLSFSGIVTFKNAEDVRDAAALAPLDRVLVETDSPYLAPVPHRGSTNEPAYVAFVGAGVAAARGEDVDDDRGRDRATTAASIFLP